jgi:carbonic anhydrase
VILANVNLGVAIVAVQADRGIPYPAAARGDLNDFFEHFFSCLLLNTPHLRVWCVAIARRERAKSYDVPFTEQSPARKFNQRLWVPSRHSILWLMLVRIMGTPMLDHLKANNRSWAERMVAADADFFRRLERQQTPEYLWIGCSDSRVPANEIVGLDPGELFVHRNVANLAPPQDANYLSVLQFAVDVLKVKHIMVVGHYGCGGVSAAVDGKRRGLVDHWLHPIREVYREHRDALDAIPDWSARLDRLCELNVIRQVRNVASDVLVHEAWTRGQDLRVHGWIYSLANGLVMDLDVTVSWPEEIERLR